VKFLIFSNKFCKFHSVGVLSQDPAKKKNSTSLILVINLRVGFEPCISLELILFFDFLILFVNMRLRISFAGVEIS
jgi:hypothetical protein